MRYRGNGEHSIKELEEIIEELQEGSKSASARGYKACPTQAGSFTGYEVQIKTNERGWRLIPIEEVSSGAGVPLPMVNRGILDTLGLLGYEQAKSLAWTIRAVAASKLDIVEVRIMPYDVQYDAKAYKREADVEAI